jgi:hypothetical protein
MFDKWPYQTDKVALLPYERKNLVFPDDLLYKAYLKTKEQNLLEVAFPGIPDINFDKFMGCMLRNATQVYTVKNGDEPITAGLCFVYNVDGEPGARMAHFGFWFFREWQAKRETRDLVWLCLAYWFLELKIDILYGVTLASNHLAKNFSRNFGFINHGVMPEFLCRGDHRVDANVVSLRKSDFVPRFDVWHKKKLAEMNNGQHQGRNVIDSKEREGHRSGFDAEF